MINYIQKIPNLQTQVLFLVISRMFLILMNVVVRALLWRRVATEQLLGHDMILLQKLEDI